ncbi:hypothetical protein HPP92_009281 [Vanilla planifolia]|uniref:Pentatricopeptide repeat-containing protein n=1 Tax=Vanilla planifolia TaxID=51239 RepID=A0A835RFX3_VANPL|nr:hypothetical protein HPP92_009281 [Vanilla planifolia]
MAVTASTLLERLLQHAVRPKSPTKTLTLRPPKPPSSTILRHLSAGDIDGAIAILSSSPSPFPASVYSRFLLLCASRRALIAVRRVESHIISSCHPSTPPTFLMNRVIETYARCGCISDARQLFDEVPRRNGGTWNAIISAYARCGCPTDATELFARMHGSGILPKDVTFASVLGSCAHLLALTLARQVHGLILKFGFCVNVILSTSLVDVYGKCQINMDDAQKMFDEIPEPNPVSWNVIVRRYLDLGERMKAACMFLKMIRMGVRPLSFTYSSALVACSDISLVLMGCQIHGNLVKSGFERDYIIETSLMEMYAKSGLLEDALRIFNCCSSRDVVSWTSMVSGYASCGRISEAEMLFEEMPERNVISWNALLAGYVRSCFWEKSIEFFQQMQGESSEINLVTLGLMLNACAGLLDVDRGKQIHGFVCRHLFKQDLFFSNALLDMYTKCGCLRSAELWFREIGLARDTVTWNSLLSGYARHGRSEEAFIYFSAMLLETTPNEFTFSVMLAAAANIPMVEHGKQMHGRIIRKGLKKDEIIRAALVDMYCKCQLLLYAIRVFEEETSSDVVLWNSLILGYAYNGRGDCSIKLFEAMQMSNIRADNITFNGLLRACIAEGYVNLGRQYFDRMGDEFGVLPRVEHYERMIELLGRYGYMLELEEFIQRMPFEPTIPMWNRIYDFGSKQGYGRLEQLAFSRI